MMNEEMRTLTLSRYEMCRIQSALTHIVIDFREEIHDPSTTDSRKKIAECSLKMWQTLRDKVDAQLDEQDEDD